MVLRFGSIAYVQQKSPTHQDYCKSPHFSDKFAIGPKIGTAFALPEGLPFFSFSPQTVGATKTSLSPIMVLIFIFTFNGHL